jgi:predicted GNAT family acetyltransferase
MRIQHEEKETRGKFFVTVEGEQAGELAYRKTAPDKINIYHTEVDESLRGKGVGGDLVKAAVDMARKEGLKIVATCPFAKKVMEHTPEYADVRAAE